jgi:hypothetical protein
LSQKIIKIYYSAVKYIHKDPIVKDFNKLNFITSCKQTLILKWWYLKFATHLTKWVQLIHFVALNSHASNLASVTREIINCITFDNIVEHFFFCWEKKNTTVEQRVLTYCMIHTKSNRELQFVLHSIQINLYPLKNE